MSSELPIPPWNTQIITVREIDSVFQKSVTIGGHKIWVSAASFPQNSLPLIQNAFPYHFFTLKHNSFSFLDQPVSIPCDRESETSETSSHLAPKYQSERVFHPSESF